jgi:hypothetical protein
MRLSLHYHWPLRDKAVQVAKVIPQVEGEELTKAVESFIEEALRHTQVGFSMEIKIEED